jgi:hypothetical protein
MVKEFNRTNPYPPIEPKVLLARIAVLERKIKSRKLLPGERTTYIKRLAQLKRYREKAEEAVSPATKE